MDCSRKIKIILILSVLIVTSNIGIAEMKNMPYSLPIKQTNFEVDDWSMFRHDPYHSGFSTSEAPDKNNILWTHSLGGLFIDSSPAFYDDKIYVGSSDGKICCLYSTDGSEIWTYTTGDYIRSSPAVADGKVFVGSNDGKIYCLDVDPFDDLIDEGFDDPDDVGYDLLWVYLTGGDVYSSPTVVEDRVYVGSNDKKVYCLDAGNGALIWQNQTGGKVVSSPAVLHTRGGEDLKVYFERSGDNFLSVFLEGEARVIYEGKLWKETT